ncbi:DNA replication factor Cdt1 isoform X2 [Oryzias melastigma]|uniref:DNA replication factor Cdt1 isoform X2 n=1 Tax=Oryzias melastigma TaxID=30732 RepID=UPI000CF7FB79|nr:DNA replication factor Cdt1 isoform X2 [Oryzias melastigma]
MAQVRLTEFFSQRKKGASGPRKPAAGALSSPVHREFVRVIDEAAGPADRSPDPAEPHTPKRPSGQSPERESAAAEHSSAKRKRRVPAGAGEPAADTGARRGARKKLVLPGETGRPKTPLGGAQTQVLCKEDVAALKCRLQKIQKHAEEVSPASSSSAPPADVHSLQARLVLAKQLSAKVQKRVESEGKREDAHTQDSERPAYQRYHTLARDIPPGLVLPLHFRLLAEMFRSMDTVVAMLYNRSETATFAKIQQGVQDMTHRRFEQNHVGQIRTVFPEAYTLKQEKNIPTFTSGAKKGQYQLTVEPIIVSGQNHPHKTWHRPLEAVFTSVSSSDQNQARPVLSASRLLERRRVFHQNLISLVKQHHQEFLSSLVPPVSVPDDKLTRWHPRFNVDLVPAVPASLLPQPPHRETLSTAQEVLDRARLLINPKMEKALTSAAQRVQLRTAPSSETSGVQKVAEPAAPAGLVPESLKGVSQSLLDRIRAKEAQKLQAVMTRDPAQEERLLMMSRLLELARILRSVFVAEKKASLTMEAACSRMAASYSSALTAGEMEKHVHLLAELAAGWLTLHPIRKDVYLKLDRKVELSVVLDKLGRRLREEEQK